MIDDARSGRSPSEEYEGNSAIFRATPAGVTAEVAGWENEFGRPYAGRAELGLS